MRIVVINHVTLDGVMQGPGDPDEDARGDFTRGGWAGAGNDPLMIQAIGARMSKPGGAMLLGRRSYDSMLSRWNSKGGSFKDGLNNASKYVVSTNIETVLKWPNSTLLSGNIPACVANLKARPGGNLVIMGSGQLIRSIMPHGLIDEYLLMIHPLVLGSGMRLFEHDGCYAALTLNHWEAAPSGVILATYRPNDF